MLYVGKKEINKFSDWLTERGAIVDPTTSQWEVVRVRTCFGTYVVYRNNKDKQTWPSELQDLYGKFKKNIPISLSPDLKSRVQMRVKRERLAERDRLECWFCEYAFLNVSSAEITIEHLVSICHGGPNHESNLVLACKYCNQEVGNKSVAEKVLYRDICRGHIPEKTKEVN